MTAQGLHNLADAWTVVCVVFAFFAFICWAGRNRHTSSRPGNAGVPLASGVPPRIFGLVQPERPSVIVIPRSEFETLKARLARLEALGTRPSPGNAGASPVRRETQDAINRLCGLYSLKRDDAAKLIASLESKLGPVSTQDLVTAAFKEMRKAS